MIGIDGHANSDRLIKSPKTAARKRSVEDSSVLKRNVSSKRVYKSRTDAPKRTEPHKVYMKSIEEMIPYN